MSIFSIFSKVELIYLVFIVDFWRQIVNFANLENNYLYYF